MNNEIGFSGLIDKAKLQSNNYFSSLSKQAYDCGLISDGDVERIKIELFLLLGEICKTITEKGTSSIQIDTAEEISESILYTLSLRLKKCPSPENAAKLLQNEKIGVLFEEGQKELSDNLINLRAKWTVLQRKLFKTQSHSFTESAKETMKKFFTDYDYKLSAHKNVVLFDYPVYKEGEKLSGLEYISQKLDCFVSENEFLNNFDSQAVHCLLLLLDGIYGEEAFYLEAPINIYMYVLSCALGLVMCEKDPYELKIEREDYDFIESRLAGQNNKNVLLVLYDALDKLTDILTIDEKTRDYLLFSIRQLASEISLSNGENLKSVFLCRDNILS